MADISRLSQNLIPLQSDQRQPFLATAASDLKFNGHENKYDNVDTCSISGIRILVSPKKRVSDLPSTTDLDLNPVHIMQARISMKAHRKEFVSCEGLGMRVCANVCIGVCM